MGIIVSKDYLMIYLFILLQQSLSRLSCFNIKID